MSTNCALPAIKSGSTGDFYAWRWGEHSKSWMLFLHKREAMFSCYSQTFVADADKARTEARLMQVGMMPLPPEYFREPAHARA